LARTSRTATGGEWHSFGHMNGGGRAEVSRSYVNNVRTDGQWHSFGNSRNVSLGRNFSEYSFSAANRANPSDILAFHGRFNSNRSLNAPAMPRFSSFSSFSGERSIANFGSSRRFGTVDFASSSFGGSGYGDLGFSNSLLGSGLSLFPNLLIGSLLHLGTAALGGGGMLAGGVLAGNAISLAAQWLGSGLGSNGFGQDDSADVGFGYNPGGFGIGFGFAPALVSPACSAVMSFQGPGSPWRGYCGPTFYQPPAWNGVSKFGDRLIR
jgi:hypothetical protein